MIRKAIPLFAGAMLLTAAAAHAFAPDPIDLTSAGNTYTGADGVKWSNLKGTSGATQPSGTGIYDPFLREQANGGDNGVEFGLNTDATVAEPLDNVGNDPHTHSVLMGSLQSVTVGGINYFSFTLDLNEPSGSGQNFLSLNQLMIYTTPNAAGNMLATLGAVQAAGTLRYNMDATTDQTVWLDYNNSNTEKDHGSGVDDMEVLIPTSYFGAFSATDYMYFYAVFGESGVERVPGTDKSWFGEDGFEEWRVHTGAGGGGTTSTPEPGTLALLGFGLVGLIGSRRKK